MIDKKSAGIVFACCLLAGCAGMANAPTTLSKLPAPASTVETYADRPIYSAIDKYSFSQATLLYPAGEGYHQIPVGDYMIGRLLEALVQRNDIELLRLARLDAKCENGGGINRRAICRASYLVDVRTSGQTRAIAGATGAMTVGGVYVVRDQLLLTAVQYSDTPILKQAKMVVDAVLQDMLAKL